MRYDPAAIARAQAEHAAEEVRRVAWCASRGAALQAELAIGEPLATYLAAREWYERRGAERARRQHRTEMIMGGAS